MPLGLLSGYVGGWLDRILVLIMDALFAFPSLLLAIVVAFLLVGHRSASGIVVAAIAITVVYIPQYFRVVRNTTSQRREEHLHRGGAGARARKPRTIMRSTSSATSSRACR